MQWTRRWRYVRRRARAIPSHENSPPGRTPVHVPRRLEALDRQRWQETASHPPVRSGYAAFLSRSADATDFKPQSMFWPEGASRERAPLRAELPDPAHSPKDAGASPGLRFRWTRRLTGASVARRCGMRSRGHSRGIRLPSPASRARHRQAGRDQGGGAGAAEKRSRSMPDASVTRNRPPPPNRVSIDRAEVGPTTA